MQWQQYKLEGAPKMLREFSDAITSTLSVLPKLVITVYENAVILRKYADNGSMTEYPVDPTDMVEALQKNQKPPAFTTGYLRRDNLAVMQRGQTRIVISYRKPQITGIWLEGGSDDALRVPMPGLIMVKQFDLRGSSKNYSIYAVTRFPRPHDRLYHAPMPNLNPNGSCWGTVKMPDHRSNNLRKDWEMWLGSRFGNHMTANRSKAFKDVREHLMALDGQETFPFDDLVPLGEQRVKSLWGMHS